MTAILVLIGIVVGAIVGGIVMASLIYYAIACAVMKRLGW